MTTELVPAPDGMYASHQQDVRAKYVALGQEIERINAAWADLTAICETLMAPIREEDLATTEGENAIKLRFAMVNGPLYRLCPQDDYRPGNEAHITDIFSQRAAHLANSSRAIGNVIDHRRTLLLQRDKEENARQARAAAYARQVEEEKALHARRMQGEDV